MEYVLILMPSMLKGTSVTLQLFFLTLIITLPLGVILALARLTKFKPLNLFMQLYVWVFRGTPLLLQLFFVYFGLGILGLKIDRFSAAVLAFVLNYAAYYAEIFRAGIQSIDRGQYEAADVLGLTRVQTMTKIVLPQVFRRVLPPVSNEVINLIKDTALVYAIGMSELLRVAKTAAVRDFSFIPFLVAAVFYLAMTGVVQQFFKWLEAKTNFYR
ncbi:MAG TPA: amino acid ABC transporter permease [Syntrophomonadaceae bacterium]|nr:amino acid ABC transporter permease [Syntrophomonadaceae bacterium]